MGYGTGRLTASCLDGMYTVHCLAYSLNLLCIRLCTLLPHPQCLIISGISPSPALFNVSPYIIYYVGFLYLYVICPWLIENQVQVASVWPRTSISVRNSPEVFRPANKKTVFRDISEYFAWNSNPMPERLLTGGYIQAWVCIPYISIQAHIYGPPGDA